MTAPRHIDWDTVQSAFTFALGEHGDQARKGTDIPYMAHLWGVAALVLEHGGRTEHVVAALLHDTAEDQGGEETLARVEAAFGAEVAGIVRALSDAMPAAGEEKPPWHERKRAYVASLGDEPVDVLLVSAADKLNNLRATIADTGALASLDLMELNPARDVRNQTAELVVDLVESLFGKSTLMRPR